VRQPVNSDGFLSASARHDVIKRVVQKERLSVTVTGECMTPLIRDQATLEVARPSTYWPGDVVVVQASSGAYLVHRLIGALPRNGVLKVFTQADSSRWPDAAVTQDALLGKVCGGECARAAIDIPFTARVTALGRFTLFALAYVASRIYAKSV